MTTIRMAHASCRNARRPHTIARLVSAFLAVQCTGSSQSQQTSVNRETRARTENVANNVATGITHGANRQLLSTATPAPTSAATIVSTSAPTLFPSYSPTPTLSPVPTSNPTPPENAVCTIPSTIIDLAPNWISANNSNTIGAFNTSAEYELQFELHLAGAQVSWGSILHIGNSNADRFPAIQFNGGSFALHVRQSSEYCASCCCDYGINTDEMEEGGKYNISVRVFENEMIVLVNGVLQGSGASSDTTYHDPTMPAAVYVGSPFEAPANVRLRSIRYMSDFVPGACPTPAPTASPFPTAPVPTPAPTLLCGSVELAPEWVQVSQGNQIGTITTSSNYELTFEMEITGGFAAWNNILTFGTQATRQPWIGFSWAANEFHIKQAKSDGWHDQYGPDSVDYGLVQGSKYNITIRCMDNTMTVFIDGDLKWTESADDTYASHEEVAVYAGDPWHTPAAVRLRSVSYSAAVSGLGCPTQVPTALPSPMPTPPPSSSPTPIIDAKFAPESLNLATTKPNPASGTAYFVNPNDESMFGVIGLLETTLSWSVSPKNFTLAPGGIQEIVITIESTSLEPRAYSMLLELRAQTLNSLPIARSFAVELIVNAKADPDMTQVVVQGSPTLDLLWEGVQIFPIDADGFAILDDRGGDFDVLLARDSGGLVASCTIRWSDAMYKVDCVVPDTSLAGDWTLTVTLDGTLVHATTVHPQCAPDNYEDPDEGNCMVCPQGTECPAGTILAELPLVAGNWRSGKSWL